MEITKSLDKKEWSWKKDDLVNRICKDQGIDIILYQTKSVLENSIRFYSDAGFRLFAVLLNYLDEKILLDEPESNNEEMNPFLLEALRSNPLPVYNPDTNQVEINFENYEQDFIVAQHANSNFTYCAYLKENNLALGLISSQRGSLNQVVVFNDGRESVVTLSKIEEMLIYDRDDARILLDAIYQFSFNNKQLYDLSLIKKN